MSGYTDVLQVMLAMILISVLTLNANRTIHINNVSMKEGLLEEQVIAYAQDIIEEARALAFDAVTAQTNEDGTSVVPVYIPDGFTATGSSYTEDSRQDFNDFDDYDGWQDEITINGITYQVSTIVDYVTTSDYQTYTKTSAEEKSTLKRLTVHVESDFLKESGSDTKKKYSFSFIRSYYAD